jgi:hypothetical protein
MNIIPVQPLPAQTFNTVLGNQNCTISLYQKTTGMYLDLAINEAVVITGALCRDRVKIVRYGYLGFAGDLAFIDTQGAQDPEYQGLGDRWQLVYNP